MQLSRRADKIYPSPTLALASKARALKASGKDVISFAVGEPDFATPANVVSSAKIALDKGETHYSLTNGVLELREAIAKKLLRDNQLNFSPDEIVATPGAKIAIYNALQLLVDEGDEVIFSAPYWVSYPVQVELAGGKSVVVKTDASTNFKLTADKLRMAATSKTKVLILNSPSNPTGSVHTEDELRQIANVCVEKNITVISDEIYEKLVYGGVKHISIASFPDMLERTVVINGLSKSYAMTGWRVGYVAAKKPFIGKMNELIGQQTTCLPPFIQSAAIAALNSAGDDVEKMRKVFEKRRDLFIEELSKMPKIKVEVPNGAFYVWVDVRNLLNSQLKSSLELANYLLEKKFLAAVPGEDFGSPGFLRFSYAVSEENIKAGAKRFGEAVGEIGK